MAATSYEQWRTEAQARDAQTGAARWKADDRSDLFDYRVIRRRRDELVELRAAGDPRRLLYYLNEGLHGNMGGMGSSQLYRHAEFGTKDLVSDYVREMSGALDQLAGADDGTLPFGQKLAFFRRARQAFGNCALMLSGAGSLGPFHLGVAKALAEQGLLPAVISGASAGGLIAAAVCTRTDDELREMFERDALPARLPGAPRRTADPTPASDPRRPARRGRGHRARHDLRRSARTVRARPEHLRGAGGSAAAVAHAERGHVAQRADPRSGHGDVRDSGHLSARDPGGAGRGRQATPVRALAKVGRRLGHRRHAYGTSRPGLRVQLLHRQPGEPGRDVVPAGPAVPRPDSRSSPPSTCRPGSSGSASRTRSPCASCGTLIRST